MIIEKRLTTSHAVLGNAILRFLWDDGRGGWRDINDVLSAIGPTIPPGKAFRTNERQRKNCYNINMEKTASEERERGTRDMAIAYGRRQILSQSISSLQTSGWIEIEYDDYTKKRKAYKRIRMATGVEPIFPHEFKPSLEVSAEGYMLCESCGHQRRLKYIHGESSRGAR